MISMVPALQATPLSRLKNGTITQTRPIHIVHVSAGETKLCDPDRFWTEFPEVRAARERNDETLGRIHVGRRFKNDTERLEHLFDRYAKMTAKESKKAGAA